MESLVALKTASEDFEVEYEILSPIDFLQPTNEAQREIMAATQSVDKQIDLCDQRIAELNAEIGQLTNQADGIDYALSVTCGLLTGLFDTIFVGEWNFENAKAISNEDINRKITDFAKKDPQYADFIARKREENKDPDRLKNVIEFLENKYKLPGDGDYNFKNSGVTHNTHHLDDFCHHPTLVGLVCCILVQFTEEAKYHPVNGSPISVANIQINSYGNFVSPDSCGKVFAGIINWFFNAARTIANRKGHLMSDMAGSKTSKNGGAGIPGSFLSTLKELSTLPCFEDSNFAKKLQNAYQNGIGQKKNQLNLGVFNSLFEGADSNKFDMRTEMAVGHELKRQALPVVMNEILVRSIYFVRRFIDQMRIGKSIFDLDWNAMLPFRNRTIVRMLSIASGTFATIDIADATAKAAVKSGGNGAMFLSNFVLRVNFVGIGRFAVAITVDAGMGVMKLNRENERMAIMGQQLTLLNTKVFYKCAEVQCVEADMFESQRAMWVTAEDASKTLAEAYGVSQEAMVYCQTSIQEIYEELECIGQYLKSMDIHNPGLTQEMINILKWGKK